MCDLQSDSLLLSSLLFVWHLILFFFFSCYFFNFLLSFSFWVLFSPWIEKKKKKKKKICWFNYVACQVPQKVIWVIFTIQVIILISSTLQINKGLVLTEWSASCWLMTQYDHYCRLYLIGCHGEGVKLLVGLPLTSSSDKSKTLKAMSWRTPSRP